jgi:hypothetical protein
MTDRMNDDFILCDLIEYEERIGCCRQAANDGIVRADADFGVRQEDVDDPLNTRLAPCGETEAT